MRILYSSQNQTLDIFHDLDQELRRRKMVESSGFIVADRFHFYKFAKHNPGFESSHAVLKEWEITRNLSGDPDIQFLKTWEERLKVPNLLIAMLSDRRICTGRNSAFTQDYASRFNDDQMLVMLKAAIEGIERLFETLQPQVLVGFISVTFLDFLAVKYARYKGVQVLNLRPSRIGDHVYFADDLLDPSEELVQLIEKNKTTISPKKSHAEAYLAKFRAKAGRYEGVVPPSERPARRLNFFKNPFSSVSRHFWNYIEYRRSGALTDNHVPPLLKALFYGGIINPLRARSQRRQLQPVYFNPLEQKNFRFAFYPLHAEPEVSLLVYGRPFLNQLEVIRAISDSLPVDMLLVIKEHPWMVGKRKSSYYKKLLEIPKVRIVRPSLEARTLVMSASVTFVIAGSVAFEAAILGKPAITMGHVPFNVLPKNMMSKCTDLANLTNEVQRLLLEHKHDETALVNYVASVMEITAPVQWYSTLLKRSDAHTERSTDYQQEIVRLADYLVSRLRAAH